MSCAKLSWTKWSIAGLVLLSLAGFGRPASGQDEDNRSANGGYVDDWSHHYVVFSNPGTREDAINNGKLAQWEAVTNSRRYQMQLLKRSRGSMAPLSATPDLRPGTNNAIQRILPPTPVHIFPIHPAGSPILKDWSQALGGVTTSLVSTLAGTNTSSTVSSASTLTIGSVTLAASAPTTGTATVTILCIQGGSCASNTNDASEISRTSTLKVGTVTYTVSATGNPVSSSALVSNTNSSDNGPDANQMAANFAAAINNSPQSACGATPSVGGGCYCATNNGCTGGISTPNPEASATVNGNIITLTGNGAVPIACSGGMTCSAATLSGSDGTTSSTTFKYTTSGAYDTGTQLATDITNAVKDNTTVLYGTGSTDKITPAANNNEITFTTTTVGPYAVSVANFPGFTGVGTISDTAFPATVEANAYPAEYGASGTTASCSDFVIYPTGQEGGSSSATIIAYKNLYSSCSGSGAVPTVAWAVNTGNNYAVTTSPALSPSGTEVAFIQSNGTNADLVVLKFAGEGGALGSPLTPATCGTPPCMTVTQLTNIDTISSPFYDFEGSDDAIYVGDNSGYLEKFTGVFNGTVTPVTPIKLNSTTPEPLASPIYDSTSGCVFVGDTYGYLYEVNSGNQGTAASPTCTKAAGFSVNKTSELLSGGAVGDGIYDGVLFDTTDEQAYVFVADSAVITRPVSATFTSTHSTAFSLTSGTLTQADVNRTIAGTGLNTGTTIATVTGATTGTLNQDPAHTESGASETITMVTTAGDEAVDEFPVGFGAGATPEQAEPLGTGGTGYNLYAGTFDNVFYESPTDSGNLYEVGNAGTAGAAELFQLTITDGLIAGIATPVTGLNTTEYPWPSPLTEFCNTGGASACALNSGQTATTTGNDYIFFSVNEGAATIGTTTTGCTASAGDGCIYSYNVSTGAPLLAANSALNVTTPPAPNGCWATGAIVIDNSATSAGASQIYFVGLNGEDTGSLSTSDAVTPASANCTAGTSDAVTLQGVQASQAAP